MTDQNSQKQSATHVIIDTGVFVYRTRLLSTSLGAAFIYSLDRTGFKIGLPEVIELEVMKHTKISLNKAISQIEEGYRIIETTMGSRDDYKVPTEVEIEKTVANRFEELSDFISRIPFTFDHAKAALMRVVNEIPPNRPKDQQYKDSAIWEAVLEQSKKTNVHFITEDKAFFQARDPKKGLASELINEVENLENTILVHYQLENYLKSIQDEILELNEDAISTAIVNLIIDQLLERAADKNYQLGNLSRHKIEAFVTERPQILAVKFRIEFEVFNVTLNDRNDLSDGVEIVEGNCSFNTVGNEVSDILFDKISIKDLDGNQIPGHGHYFLQVNGLVLGRKRISHQIRRPVEKID